MSAQIAGRPTNLQLGDGSSVGIVGGGPAGSMAAIFLLEMASIQGIDLEVEIFEPRDFSCAAPKGCNMCGGIISETLVQNLASEGINLPTNVVQRGIESYILHMDVGSVRIETPLHEKRIGSVYRGAGPRDLRNTRWASFDLHLESLASSLGAREKENWSKGLSSSLLQAGASRTTRTVARSLVRKGISASVGSRPPPSQGGTGTPRDRLAGRAEQEGSRQPGPRSCGCHTAARDAPAVGEPGPTNERKKAPRWRSERSGWSGAASWAPASRRSRPEAGTRWWRARSRRMSWTRAWAGSTGSSRRR